MRIVWCEYSKIFSLRPSNCAWALSNSCSCVRMSIGNLACWSCLPVAKQQVILHARPFEMLSASSGSGHKSPKTTLFHASRSTPYPEKLLTRRGGTAVTPPQDLQVKRDAV